MPTGWPDRQLSCDGRRNTDEGDLQRDRFGLMVGIGGGVLRAEVDIRLGDVVVSQPDRISSGVVQYDLGKATPSGFDRTGSLNLPPQILLGAVAKVRAIELRGRSRLSEYFSQLCHAQVSAQQCGIGRESRASKKITETALGPAPKADVEFLLLMDKLYTTA
ncbi:hypothetical protein B0J14DRAFT_592270 [Halenospora varia]|nr:hypothetical protein B0J14DRAFT_592270 [Halenospora varia]